MSPQITDFGSTERIEMAFFVVAVLLTLVVLGIFLWIVTRSGDAEQPPAQAGEGGRSEPQ